MTPVASVVIVTFNSSPVIRACLESLSRSRMSSRTEVIVVDNMSSDGTAVLIRREFPDVTVVDAGANLGFAAANRLGVSLARADFFLLLNPDTEVTPDAIPELLGVMTADRSIWVAGPRIVRGNRCVGHASGDLPTLWWALAEVGPGNRFGLHSSRVVSRMDSCLEDRDVGFITGASLFTTRAAWEQLGGLDEDYFLYFEDTDYCARVWRAGGRVRLACEAEVVHLEGLSFGDQAASRNSRYLQGLVLYLARNSSPLAAQVFRLSVLAEHSLYVLAGYLPGRALSGVRRMRQAHATTVRALTQRGLTQRAPRGA